MPVYALGELVPDIHPDAYVHPDAVVIGKAPAARILRTAASARR